MGLLDYIIARIIERSVEALLIGLLKMLLRKLSLEKAKDLVIRWTWFYTSFAPDSEREDIRRQVRSDIDDQIKEISSEGRDGSAADILGRAVRSVPGDLAYTVLCIPRVVAEDLDRRIARLEAGGNSKLALTGIAGCIFWALGALIRYPNDRWWELLICAALSLPGTIVFFRYYKKPSVRRRLKRIDRPLTIVVWAVFLISTALYTWMVIHLQLYIRDPLTYQLPLALLPLGTIVMLATKQCRDRFFGGSWKPAMVCSVIVAVTSLGSVWLFAENPGPWLAIWGSSLLLCLVFLGIVAFCVGIALLVWRVGIRVSVVAMRIVAASMRRMV